MNISIGSTQKPSFTQKARRVYGRLTTKGKIVFGVIILILLYLIFPSFKSESSDSSSLNYISRSSDTGASVGTGKSSSISTQSHEISTLSDLLNFSPQTNPIVLSYLSLPPYVDSNNKFPHYKNGGNMLLSRNAEYVRLVKDSPKNSGNLFSTIPISADDLSAFELEISFKISGEQDKIGMIGDGMAIWLTTEQLEQGDVFGMKSDFNGLGIFLDTYKNHNGRKNRNAFPYLSIQRNRGDADYYDKSMDGIDTQIGGCSLHRIYNIDGESSKLRISYIRQAKIFEIDADIEGDGNWKTCFRKENVEVDELLPVGRPLYLGVSAETGDLHHNVDVFSIKATTFRKNDGNFIDDMDSLGEGLRIIQPENTENEDETSNNQRNRVPQRRRKNRKTLSRLRRQERELKRKDFEKYGSEHGFVGWFFGLIWYWMKVVFMILLALIAIYACVIGFRVWKDKQKKKNIGGII